MEDLSIIQESERKRRRRKRRVKRVGIILVAAAWIGIVVFFVVQQLGTNGASFLLTLGQMQWKLGMREGAVSSYWNACERNPDNESLSKYINAMRALGRSDEVDERLNSLPSSMLNEYILKTLSTFQIERKNFARAKTLCDNWVALSPNSADALLLRGRVNEELRAYRAAESDYLKSNTLLQSDQAVSGLLRVRQRLIWSDNTYSQIMDMKFEGDPNSPRDKLTHAFKLSLGAENKEAFAIYDDLVKHKQLLPASYLGRGIINYRLDRFDDALKDFDLAEKNLRKVAPSGEIEYTRIRIVGHSGKEVKSTSLNQIFGFRARTLLAMKRYKEALVEIDKAIAIKEAPGDFWTRAQIHRGLGMHEEAAKDDEEVDRRTNNRIKSKSAQEHAQTLFYMMAE